MGKKKLIEYCTKNLGYEQMNEFEEFAQFCEDTLKELIPYLNTQGLKILKRKIKCIKEQ